MRSAGDLTEHLWTYGVRYITGQIDRATWRHTLTARVSPDVSLGLEYNPRVGEVGLRGNWRLVRESRTGPALTLGTSSDRIGTPDGQAYFLTVSKDLFPLTGWPVAPYASLFFSEFEQKLLFPVGASIALSPQWSVMPLSDGHAFHLLVTYSAGRTSITGLLIRGRDPGIAVNIGL